MTAASVHDVFVPTLETCRVVALLEAATISKQPVLLSGPPGSGKTTFLSRLGHRESCQLVQVQVRHMHCALQLDPLTATLWQCSAATGVPELHEGLLRKLQKRRKLYSAPPGRTALLFLDDLHVVGTSSTPPGTRAAVGVGAHELLRELLEYDSFHIKAEGRRYSRVVIEGVLLHASVGQCALHHAHETTPSPRLVRHFWQLSLGAISVEATTTIYTKVIQAVFSRDSGFPSNVARLAPRVVAATVELCMRGQDDLPSTPTREHYSFDIRDVAQVIQGVTRVRPRCCQREDSLAKLWYHECARTFHDRLIDAQDRRRYTDIAVEILGEGHFKGMVDGGSLRGLGNLLWVDFLKGPGVESSERYYEEASDPARLLNVAHNFLVEFNERTPTRVMPLVLFDAAVRHLARTVRVLQARGRHLILLGDGGVGKGSMARLATHIAAGQCIEVQRPHDEAATGWFHASLREACMHAGLHGKSVTLIVRDNELEYREQGAPPILEQLSAIMATGELGGLFSAEDFAAIHDALEAVVKGTGSEATAAACVAHFSREVVAHLHVLLVMSSTAGFRRRCREHPALLSRCTVDVYESWPDEALCGIAEQVVVGIAAQQRRGVVEGHLFQPAQLFTACTAAHRSVQAAAAKLHRGIVEVHTPLSAYVNFLECFAIHAARLLEQLEEQRAVLRDTVAQVETAQRAIRPLEEKISQVQPAIQKMGAQADEIRLVVHDTTEKANVQRTKVAGDTKTVKVREEQLNEEQVLLDQQIASTQPALEQSHAALSQLNKGDLGELKAFKNPAANVVKVMITVLLLLGHPKKKQTWDDGKVLLAQSDCLAQCRSLDLSKGKIDDKTCKALAEACRDPEMIPEALKAKNSAAAALGLWVHAVNSILQLQIKMRPEEETMATKMSELANMKEALETKRKELEQIESTLVQHQGAQSSILAKLASLETERTLCQTRLARAKALVAKFSEHATRWRDEVRKVDKQTESAVGDSFLAGIQVAYLGALPPQCRGDVMDDCAGHAFSNGIVTAIVQDSARLWTDKKVVRAWQAGGLHEDSLGVASAVAHSRLPCLLVDPQGLGRAWLQVHEPELQIVQAHSADWGSVLRAALQAGDALLVEGVGTQWPPVLLSVLEHLARSRQIAASWLGSERHDPKGKPNQHVSRTKRRRGSLMAVAHADKTGGLLDLAGKEVRAAQGFVLYLSSDQPCPVWPAQLCAKVNIVDFTPSRTVVEDLVLSQAFALEDASSEQRYAALQLAHSTSMTQAEELENKMLSLLSNVEGNLMDDPVLLEDLEAAQKAVLGVEKGMDSNHDELERVAGERLRYHCVAVRAGALFQELSRLWLLEPVYDFSLTDFLGVVRAGMQGIPPVGEKVQPTTQEAVQDGDSVEHAADGSISDDPMQARQRRLRDRVTTAVHNMAAIAVSAPHLSVWVLQLGAAVAKEAGTLPDAEWNLFIHGPPALPPPGDDEGEEEEEAMPSSVPDETWLTVEIWETLLAAEQAVPGLAGTCARITEHSSEWKRWVFTDDVAVQLRGEQGPMQYSPWQRVCLVKIMRPVRAVALAMHWVSQELGVPLKRPLRAGLLDTALLAATNATTPILVVYSAGYEPGAALERLAPSIGLRAISGGDGLTSAAIQAVEAAREAGGWIMVQNSDTALLEGLDNALLRWEATDPHPDFRLWVVTPAGAPLPARLARWALKVRHEPPHGLQQSMVRALHCATTLPASELPEERQQDWAKVVFSIAACHAVLQGRSRFPGIGWATPHHFTDSHLESTIGCAQDVLALSGAVVPFGTMVTLVADVHHGAGIMDAWDRRALKAVARGFLCAGSLEENYVFAMQHASPKPPPGERPGAVRPAAKPKHGGRARQVSGVPQPRMSKVSKASRPGSNVVSRRSSVVSVSSQQSQQSGKMGRKGPLDVSGAAKLAVQTSAGLSSARHSLQSRGSSVSMSSASSGLRFTGGSGVTTTLICSPGEGTVEGYLSHILALQHLDGPGNFTVHDNAFSALHTSQLDQLTQAVMQGQQQPAAEPADGLAVVQGLLTEMPGEVDHDELERSMQDEARPPPLLVALLVELQSCNRLIATVRAQLKALERALLGKAVLGPELCSALEALNLGRTPRYWLEAGFPCVKPVAGWLEHLEASVTMLRTWLDEGVVLSWWLPGLLHPKLYLAALLRMAARERRCPIDTLSLKVAMLGCDAEQVEDAPENGALVHGLFLEGARVDWSTGHLQEALGAVPYYQLPVIHLEPTMNHQRSKTAYEAPVYATPERGALPGLEDCYVMPLDIECAPGTEAAHWVLQGVAGLCQLPE